MVLVSTASHFVLIHQRRCVSSAQRDATRTADRSGAHQVFHPVQVVLACLEGAGKWCSWLRSIWQAIVGWSPFCSASQAQGRLMSVFVRLPQR
jgi:hypothetical protein